MRLLRYTLTPASPWSSRLRSDTLYGLILWHVAEGEGAKACQDLIEAFSAGNPPFVLSSPFRAGFLPMPALPPIRRADFRALAPEILPGEKSLEEALFKALRLYKSFRKMAWLPVRAWLENREDLSARKLFLWHSRQKKKEETQEEGFSTSAFEPHVAIDRARGTAMEGQLFFTRLNYFSPSASFHLYARCADPGWLEKYLKQIGLVGFGHRASTGKGLFSIAPDPDFEPQTFAMEKANASLLCSLCASADMRPLSGHYRLDEKLGKTGPGYVNPFKRPFLALQEGSVLQEPPAPPYVLRGLCKDEKIVQILQPLLFPCNLAGKEAA